MKLQFRHLHPRIRRVEFPQDSTAGQRVHFKTRTSSSSRDLMCIFRSKVLGVAWAELLPPVIGLLLLGGGMAFICIHIQYEQTVQEHATYKLA